MLDLFKKKTLPAGVDLGSGHLRMAQLEIGADGPHLIAAGLETKPENIKAGTPEWQRWAVRAARDIVHKGKFKGKKVITALPSDDLYIDQIKIPRMSEDKIADTVLSKVKNKLPFDASAAAVKHVVAEFPGNYNGELDIVVMAADRSSIERHLAIYEKAGLEVYNISAWPIAMINSHINFFGRRQEEEQSIVMLMDIGSNHCNIVICRHRNLLFARVINIGFNQLVQGQMVQRLMAEIDACGRYFESVGGGGRIERLMFLAGRTVEPSICEKVAEFAQRMQVAAQIGDVLGAVKADNNSLENIDRRESSVNWATTFGLSLAGHEENISKKVLQKQV